MKIEDYQKKSNCKSKLAEIHGEKCAIPWCRRKPVDTCCILAPFVWKSIHQTGMSAYNSINVFQCCSYHRHLFDMGIIMPQSIRKWMNLMHPAGVPFPSDFLGQESNTPLNDIPNIKNIQLRISELVVKQINEDSKIPWEFDPNNQLLEIPAGEEDFRLYFKNYNKNIMPSDFNRILPLGKYLICSAYPFHPKYITKGFASIIMVKNNGCSTDRGFFVPKRK